LCGDYYYFYGNTASGNGYQQQTGPCGNNIDIYEPIAEDAASSFHNLVSHNVSTGATNNSACSGGGNDGEGILMDTWNASTGGGCSAGNTSYAQTGLVEDNLSYGNASVGIGAVNSGSGAITFRNNTAYQNMRGCSGCTAFLGPSEFDDMTPSGTNTWVNNLGFAFRDIYSGNLAFLGGKSGAEWSNDLGFINANPASAFSVTGTTANNVDRQNPLLINPTTDIHLQSISPGAGVGTTSFPGLSTTYLAGETIPSPPDIGAEGVEATVTATPTPTPTATFTGPTATPTPSGTCSQRSIDPRNGGYLGCRP
jgi:hypothetical protein